MMTIQISGETYLSTNETIAAIGITKQTLNRYVNQGLIKRHKQGFSRSSFYKETDVLELIERRSTVREDD